MLRYSDHPTFYLIYAASTSSSSSSFSFGCSCQETLLRVIRPHSFLILHLFYPVTPTIQTFTLTTSTNLCGLTIQPVLCFCCLRTHLCHHPAVAQFPPAPSLLTSSVVLFQANSIWKSTSWWSARFIWQRLYAKCTLWHNYTHLSWLGTSTRIVDGFDLCNIVM